MTEVFSPETDSIKLGDTLYLESSHSTSFTDLSNGNGKQVNFEGSFFGTNIRILEFPDTSTEVIGAVSNFGLVIVNGSETGNDNIPVANKGVYYQELNSEFVIKIKFIALKKGIYTISIADSKAVTDGKNGCIKADFEIKNNNVDNHIYYYQNWRPGYQISEYEQTHIYCFKVY
jgi:hypothetical protein